MPYHLPSVCQAVAGTPSCPTQLETYEEISASFPVLTWVACPPLPHCWKMSGGLLPRSAGVIFVLNSSFCIGTFWIVMPGLAASNVLMTFWNTPSSGCVFALFHQVNVTLPELELLLPPVGCVPPPDVLVEPPPLLQAAAKAVAAASATAASARFVFMLLSSPQGVAAREPRSPQLTPR